MNFTFKGVGEMASHLLALALTIGQSGGSEPYLFLIAALGDV